MRNQGFTIIELLVVLAVSATILGMFTINILSFRSNVLRTDGFDLLRADIERTRLEAMLNVSRDETITARNRGIYFDTHEYVLFSGSFYDQNDTSNIHVSYPESIEKTSTTLPDSLLLFEAGSGDSIGDVSSPTVVFLDSRTQQTFRLQFTTYGKSSLE